MGREFHLALENPNAPLTKELTAEIISNLKPLVQKRWKSLKGVDVTNYAFSTTESVGVTEANHESKPSILALTQFTFDGKDSPNAIELRDYLKEVRTNVINLPQSFRSRLKALPVS
jgi:hypothetical protein